MASTSSSTAAVNNATTQQHTSVGNGNNNINSNNNNNSNNKNGNNTNNTSGTTTTTNCNSPNPSVTATTATTATTTAGTPPPQLFNNEKSAVQLAAINKAFREIIGDPKLLDDAANYLYSSLLDDAIVGVFIEIHHLHKTGNLSAIDGKAEEGRDLSLRIVDMPNFDIFGISTAKKPMDCTCPNCDRPVSAARFAPHLEKCMGMGRISSRIASRRLATKEGNSTSSSSSSSYLQTNAGTDDEDDVDWSSEKRRKKTNQSSRNGSKKNNGKIF